MNSILGQVSSGIRPAGQRIVIAAQEKIGKTTLACNAPRALLIPLELGYASFTNPKTPMLTSWEQVIQTCSELNYAARSGNFPFQTVVWDSATAMERLIHDYVLRKDKNYGKGNASALTMEAALGGYGKAYQFANEQFANWTYAMDQLSHGCGINIVVTCHVFASRVIDPTSGEFDQWDMLLHSPKNNRNYGKREMITQWADMIAYLYEPYHVILNDNQKVVRAVSQNRGRVAGIDRTPQYVAGNRYGLTGEVQIPLQGGWNYLVDPIYKAKGIDLYNRD